MPFLKNSFSSCEEYRLGAEKYSRIDILLSLFLYATLIFMYYVLGKIFISDGITLTNELVFTSTGVVSILIFIIVLLLCLFRKQRLSSVGFSRTKAKKSLRLGLVLVIGIVILFLIITFFLGFTLHSDINMIIMQFFYYLFEIAFVEELVFRGYIGTRLYGAIKNKVIAISITGLLFTLMHVPFQMLLAHMSIIDYIATNWVNLILIFLLHFIFQAIYAKYNSIIAPTLFHFVWDYMQWFIV
ncbi:MAG: hypothetical protein K0S01_617 [Herbinix sp.]|jgi:membrane protease YdiL (CAAX protease family)|nr:hypothetical protein [Herbinix sp.]